MTEPHDPRAALPAVDHFLTAERVARYGHARVVAVARAALAEARRGVVPPLEVLDARVDGRLRPTLRPVINATGVLLHTNLGRAPWSPAAIEAAAEVARGYASVELDLATGRRGARAADVVDRLRALTGCADALVVNNCAAATLLMLTTLAAGRRVAVSRGELVEIGGGFRVPDVMRASGAALVEVGTTNRTHQRDFEAAVAEHEVVATLRVHHSNFRQIGFVTQPSYAEMARLSVPLLVDLGSGALAPRDGEPSVREALDAGAALVCISGDKLLGGPQAGIVLGRADLVERLRRHPLRRALRPDKVVLAALRATLDGWLRDEAVPVRAMEAADLDGLRAAVEGWRAALADGVEAEVVAVEGAVGGGSLPGRTWPSWALAISRPAPEALRAALLAGEPPVVARIHQDRLLLDARTVVPLGQGQALVAALRAAAARG